MATSLEVNAAAAAAAAKEATPLTGLAAQAQMPDMEETTATVVESDFECALCCSIFYEPVTTDECGHTFCRLCLHRSLEVKRACPLCRAPCALDALSHPTTAHLSNLIERLFPALYSTRKEEMGDEMRRRVRPQRYGIFMSHAPLFPGAPIQLHIFEPRYRVMISRALAGSRNFLLLCVNQHREIETPSPIGGDPDEDEVVLARNPLAQPAPAHVLDPLRLPPAIGPPAQAAPPGPAPLPVKEGDLACLVKIVRCQIHADGRSFIEAVGGARVRVRDVRSEDEAAFGLLAAEAAVIEDEPSEVPPPPAQQPEADVPPADAADEADEATDEAGLRRRHTADNAHAAASSSSSSSSSSAALPASATGVVAAAAAGEIPVARQPTVPELLVECRHLLDAYCVQSGFSLERLALMNGGPCPPDSQPAEFSWWLLRVLPDSTALKHEALATTRLSARLLICVEVLHVALHVTRQRTNNQVRFIASVVLIALGMILLRQLGITE